MSVRGNGEGSPESARVEATMLVQRGWAALCVHDPDRRLLRATGSAAGGGGP